MYITSRGPAAVTPQLCQRAGLYLTNSLYSSWDNQFYPDLSSWMMKIDCLPEGGMRVDENFSVDFGAARGHEIHLPGGDCTTEIFQ